MIGVLIILVTLLSRVAAAEPVADLASSRCLSCHGMPNLAVRESTTGPLRDFSVSPVFASSVHRNVTCEQCHGDVGPYPHQVRRAPVTCTQDCHARDRDGGVYTHAATVAAFESSVHRARPGDNGGDHPTCVSCHGDGDAHAIRSPKALSPVARIAQCASCHDDPARMARNGLDADAVRSYRRSFHYKAITFGATQTAVCQDCHTAHRVRPASDATSTVARASLPATCGQASCHPGAGTRFSVSGANHLDLRVKHEPVLWAEEWLFRLLTGGTMAMLVVGIVLDVQKRFGWMTLVTRTARAIQRSLVNVAAMTRRSIAWMRWLLLE